jgi:hypothetical protein
VRAGQGDVTGVVSGHQQHQRDFDGHAATRKLSRQAIAVSSTELDKLGSPTGVCCKSQQEHDPPEHEQTAHL